MVKPDPALAHQLRQLLRTLEQADAPANDDEVLDEEAIRERAERLVERVIRARKR